MTKESKKVERRARADLLHLELSDVRPGFMDVFKALCPKLHYRYVQLENRLCAFSNSGYCLPVLCILGFGVIACIHYKLNVSW